MMRPTAEEIAAAKAECRKRFGHARVVGVPLAAPVDAYVILAALDMASASAHMDARLMPNGGLNAASALVEERRLYPSADALADITSRFGVLEMEIAGKLREAAGFVDGKPTAARLSAATAPPGMTKETAADLLAANAGIELWSISRRENGLALVVRAPAAEVAQAIATGATNAQRDRSGAITWATGYARDLCVWAPGVMPGAATGADFDRHLDEMPGRADDIGPAMLQIGGAGTARRGEFL